MLALFFGGAFLGALVAVHLIRSVALARGFVAQPKEDRWHRRPTALLGGVAIAATTLIGALISGIARELPLLLLGTGAIFVVGLVDDLLPLKPSTKLIAQIGLGSAFVFFGHRLHWFDSLTIDAALTLFWFVGITNAFNLLDNMDGLAAGVAMIAGVSILVGITALAGPTAEAKYVALLLGALGGFLVRNIYPASIFMGDSGSLFIGVTLAALTTSPSRAAVAELGLSAVIAPVMVLLIPIFDTSLVTLSRLLSGKSPSIGGKDHSSHRLVVMGLSESRAVVVLWTLAAAGGAIGSLTLVSRDSGIAVFAGILAIGMLIFAVYLSQVRVYPQATASELVRLGKITPVVVDFMHKRRVAEVLLDVCLVSLAYYASYGLRFEGDQYDQYFPVFLTSFPLVVGIQMITFFVVGLYRGLWRHFGLMDAVVLVRGVVLGVLASVVAILFIYRFENYSRGLFVIYGAVLILLISGARASFRLIAEFVRRRQRGERLIIYGAGDGGALVLQHLQLQDSHYEVLGFVDNDPGLHRARVRGYPVLGGFDVLTALVDCRDVDSIVVASQDFTASQLTQLADLCRPKGIALSKLSVNIEALIVPGDS
jgi:UDP-GlcNAc:undecaprenyl-phosphate GlcNAc-1-phosphate transferase